MIVGSSRHPFELPSRIHETGGARKWSNVGREEFRFDGNRMANRYASHYQELLGSRRADDGL